MGTTEKLVYVPIKLAAKPPVRNSVAACPVAKPRTGAGKDSGVNAYCQSLAMEYREGDATYHDSIEEVAKD
jgi:hypothetical protein